MEPENGGVESGLVATATPPGCLRFIGGNSGDLIISCFCFSFLKVGSSWLDFFRFCFVLFSVSQEEFVR